MMDVILIWLTPLNTPSDIVAVKDAHRALAELVLICRLALAPNTALLSRTLRGQSSIRPR
ncbi:hypothetical protein DK26_19300 [Bosea sp. WAO]|uniref:hypothetical protein n=1 Tax=Bosea sp. WAO TaxID=406341 RepID=UPI00074A3BD5|nr:hypothetical protein [Bosea sp. WAO]KUL93904.1 hypothetical protein DK26_19300 [Bosea sp. WAO]